MYHKLFLFFFIYLSVSFAQNNFLENTIWIEKIITWRINTLDDGIGKIKEEKPDAIASILLFMPNGDFTRFDQEVVLWDKNLLHINESGSSATYEGNWRLKGDSIFITKTLVEEMYRIKMVGSLSADTVNSAPTMDTLVVISAEGRKELQGIDKTYILSEYKWSDEDYRILTYKRKKD